jgi:hypothetical protein
MAFDIIYKPQRSGVRKGVFTRKEKMNLLSHERVRKSQDGFLAEERAKIRKEKEEREKNYRALAAMRALPDQKIRTNKDGNRFYQPKGEKGKFLPRVIIH